MKFEIVKYDWQLVNGDPKIVISMVKELDNEGKYVKFAKLKDIVDMLGECPVSFKKRDTPSNPQVSTIDPDTLPF